MPSSIHEKASTKSTRSSFHSDESIEQVTSVHHHVPETENEALEKEAAPEISLVASKISHNPASFASTGTHNPDFEIDWDDENDQTNPQNWPVWYKGLTIGFVSWSTWCVVVYSTSYTTGLAEMQADFHISSEPVVTLGVTAYRRRRSKAPKS